MSEKPKDTAWMPVKCQKCGEGFMTGTDTYSIAGGLKARLCLACFNALNVWIRATREYCELRKCQGYVDWWSVFRPKDSQCRLDAYMDDRQRLYEAEEAISLLAERWLAEEVAGG